MSGSLPISIIILAKNEARCIERCINSVRFAREILVIDSGSNDATCEIGRRLGARVIYQEWQEDFALQRNLADGHAQCEWILQIDADETVTPELALELHDFFATRKDGDYTAGQFPRKELIFGKWIEHGGWYPQYKLRLYRKVTGTWTGKVHERYDPTGPVYTFSGALTHDSYRDIHTFIDKFNKYSSLDAETEFERNSKFSLIKLLFQPVERFFGRYIIHKGFRDGFHGFVIAALIGLNYFLRYLKLWEKHYTAKNKSGPQMSRILGKSMNTILIIKPGAIGDLLHLTPVTRALKEVNPGVSITILVDSRITASLFAGNPDVCETVVFDKKGAHRSLKGLLSLWRRLRERRFDLVLNFQRSNLKAWLLASAAFPCRLIVYHKARGRVVHAVVNHLETLAPLGIDPKAVSRQLHFFPSAEDDAFADEQIRARGLAGGKVVAFNPGTAHAVKCWPIERFAELGDRLRGELGTEIIILGSTNEKALAEGIMARMRHPAHDLTGCSLGELGAILERIPLLVTGDTGPMHIASAVGTPVVALYGPISPERSGPVGEGHRIVMHGELPCCPCNSFKCRNKAFRECMEMITVDEVFAAVKEMLAEMM